jgi:tRNA/tmRNA/rRNA uracil-C5-methylase (TrmA/RlmC/RlmD family)
MEGGYCITDIQPFDLFPQTRHIESVVTMKRNF